MVLKADYDSVVAAYGEWVDDDADIVAHLNPRWSIGKARLIALLVAPPNLMLPYNLKLI